MSYKHLKHYKNECYQAASFFSFSFFFPATPVLYLLWTGMYWSECGLVHDHESKFQTLACGMSRNLIKVRLYGYNLAQGLRY